VKVTGVKCEHCEEHIKFGYDCCISDESGLYFCDNYCATEYYGIRLHTLDELDIIDVFEYTRY